MVCGHRGGGRGGGDRKEEREEERVDVGSHNKKMWGAKQSSKIHLASV